MRINAMILFMLMTVATYAQTKFFIGSDGDYAILIDESVTPKTSKPETGGYVDYYILRENNQFTFLLSVRKVGLASDPNFIYEESFKKTFVNECECESLQSERTSFKNFNGMQIEIKTSLDGKIVNGYTVGIISSGILFNVNFLALESRFNSLIPEFKKIMNHLIFR